MSNDPVYEQWKQQRAATDVSENFAASIVEAIENDRASRQQQPQRSPSRWQDRLAGTAAIALASIIGVLRVAMTLFAGIQAH